MKEYFRYYLYVWLILVFEYNIVVFALKPLTQYQDKFDKTFWIAWCFVTVAFIGQLLCSFIAFRQKNKRKEFLHISLITESYVSVILMMIAASICMLIPRCPMWVASIICFIILGVTTITLICAKAAINLIDSVDTEVSKRTLFIKSLTINLDNTLSGITDNNMKEAVKNLLEVVRYSDPMSNDSLNDIEAQISDKYISLITAISNDNSENVSTLTNEMIVLVKYRNQKCRASKQ